MSPRTQFPSVSRLFSQEGCQSHKRKMLPYSHSARKRVCWSQYCLEKSWLFSWMSQFKLLTAPESVTVVTEIKCCAWLKIDHLCVLETTETLNGLLMKQNIDIPKEVKVLVSPSWLLVNTMDGSPPGSSVHGIPQARVLEQIAIPCSRVSSQPRD